MPLTIDEKRYAEIRAGVERRRLAAKAAEVSAEPGKMTFQTVDQFLAHLDAATQAETQPQRSTRKRR